MACSVLFPLKLVPEIYPFMDLIIVSLILILTFQNSVARQLRIPKDYFTLFIFLFLLLNLLSGLWANNLSLIWKKSAFWTVLFVFYLNLRSMELEKFNSKFWTRLFWGILLTNLVFIFWSFASVAFNDAGEFFFSNQEIRDSAGLFYLNGNYIASLLVLVLAVSLIFLEQEKKYMLILSIPILVLIYVTLVYNSRGATLALISILSCFSYRYLKYKNSRIALYISGFLLISFFVGAALLIDDPEGYMEQYDPFRTVLEDTSDDRLIIWKNSLKLFAESPLLGVGSGNWIVEINKYGVNEYNGVTYRHAHNFYVESISELGILGGILSILLLIYPIFSFIKSNHEHRSTFVIVLFSVGFIVINAFYGVVYLSYKLMGLWVFAVAWYLNQKKQESFKSSLFPLSLLGILYLLALGYTYIANNAHSKLRNLPKFSKDNTSSIQIVDEIYFPNIYEFHFGDHILLKKAHYLTNKKENAIELLEFISQRTPYDYRVFFSLGRRHEINKNFPTALKYYKQAIELNALNVSPYLGITRISCRRKYWNEFELGSSIFEEVIIPSKEKFYDSEDLLESKNRREKQFWRARCGHIDIYYKTVERRNKILKKKRKIFNKQRNK